MSTIKIAIVGIGNCASSLIQGIHYYRDKSSEDATGLMHWDIGDYKLGEIEVCKYIDASDGEPKTDVIYTAGWPVSLTVNGTVVDEQVTAEGPSGEFESSIKPCRVSVRGTVRPPGRVALHGAGWEASAAEGSA